MVFVFPLLYHWWGKMKYSNSHTTIRGYIESSQMPGLSTPLLALERPLHIPFFLLFSLQRKCKVQRFLRVKQVLTKSTNAQITFEKQKAQLRVTIKWFTRPMCIQYLCVYLVRGQHISYEIIPAIPPRTNGVLMWSYQLTFPKMPAMRIS